MNFGGIIAGALSGGAQAVGQIADDNLKEQAAMRAEQRSLQLNFEKFKQEADYKLRLDRQQRQREADDTERLTARADMNMRNKDALAIDALNDKVGGDAPEMSREEIAQLLKDNPEYRKVWEDAKYMDPRKQSGIIGEQITAAREVGADPTVRKDLQTTYDRTVTAERDAVRQAQQDRRLDQTDERLANDARRTDALIQKYEQDAGSKAAKEGLREHLSYLDGQRKRLADNLRDLRQSEKSELEAIPTYETAKREAVSAEYKKKRADAEQEDRMLSADYQRVRERLFSDGPAPAPAPRSGAAASAPTAAKGGKFGNLPGEDDERKVLQEAFVKAQMAYLEAKTDLEKNRAVGNMEEIQARAKRLGLNLQNGDNAASAPAARPPLSAFKK